MNASAEWTNDGTQAILRLEPSKEEGDDNRQVGLALLEGIEFREGTIEVDLKGRSLRQQSFLGVTFHGGGMLSSLQS